MKSTTSKQTCDCAQTVRWRCYQNRGWAAVEAFDCVRDIGLTEQPKP